MISICWFSLTVGCSYAISLVLTAWFPSFVMPEVPLNLLTAPFYILLAITPNLLFGIIEFLYVRLAFMSYRQGVIISLNWFTGIKFALIQVLRNIAIFIGMLAFIFPGIYIAIRYYFPGYTLVDETTATMKDDVKRNFTLTDNVEQDLFNIAASFNFVLFVPYFLFTMSILQLSFKEARLYQPILTALTLPLLCFFYVHIYEQLKEQTPLIPNS